MIPVEVDIPSLQRKSYDQEQNHALQCYELDMLKEKRDLAALRISSYERRSERYFNSKVKERRFKEGNLVLRKVLPNTKEVNAGVLGPNWEGPYIITEVLRPGTYRIKWLDSKSVPRSWIAEHFRPDNNHLLLNLLNVYNLLSFFPDTSVNHVFRETNSTTTYVLAKFVLELDNELK